jgi:hypothetical protein
VERARAFEKEGRVDQAIVQLLEASKAKPGDWEVLSQLGLIYEKKGRLAEAAAAFEDAVRARPDNADSHFRLGRVYRALDRLEEALARFTLALQLDPDHAGARAQWAALESVRRELVPKPPEVPKREEEPVEIKPRPLVSAQSARAGAGAVAVGLAASAASAGLFLLLTSRQLVGRDAPFIEFTATAMLIVWFLSGVACASVEAPLIPLGGAVAGLVIGIGGPLLVAQITHLPLGAGFFGRAALAGTLFTPGVEFLARGTFLGEKRLLMFWGTVAAVAIFSLWRLGSLGALHGQVERYVLIGGEDYAEAVPDVAILLIASDGRTYRTVSGDSHRGYAFKGMPAGEYRIIYRDPATGYLRWRQVQVDTALTAGTHLDLSVGGRGK